jgi:ubiquinone/menaquinone biosynthesis C-methylase UbiE
MKNARPLSPIECEAEILDGLSPFACEELRRRFGQRVAIYPQTEPDAVRFRYSGDLRELLELRKVVAVYLIQQYLVPRPRGLLGHEHFQKLLRQIQLVRQLHPADAFRTFRISAAGRDSSIFARIKEEISRHTSLIYEPEEAELFLRVRPSTVKMGGWEVLVRLSPRPLSARSWRVCDMEGALNATVASAMTEMTLPKSRDRFLNLMCGSGTLLIERLARCPASLSVGCDIDVGVLECARQNIEAAGWGKDIQLLQADATKLPFPSRSFDVLCADLPWGQRVGSHEQNISLYPSVLAEAARVAVPGARLVMLTHEVTLFEGLLSTHSAFWTLKEVVRVFQGGLHPRIYFLIRTPQADEDAPTS